MSDRHADRRQKLRRLLRRDGLDGLLVTNFTNVTYLTGFTGDDSFLLVTRNEEVILSDFRYAEQLQQECPGVRCHMRKPGKTILAAAAAAVGASKVHRLGIEADSMSVSQHAALGAAMPKVELAATSGLVESLRVIKDSQEVRVLRQAVRCAEEAFEALRANWPEYATEKEAADALQHELRLRGASGASFPPIVAAGPRAALPHARATDVPLTAGPLVLIDWGADLGLYKSDLTRVLPRARISPKLERIYGVVLEAQQQAIAAVRPGVAASDVDRAARRVIEQAGFGPRFGHSVGHGIGLEIHERPRLAVGSSEELRPGMVVTIEPGIYVPGWGGVRIEDDVLVTRSGHEVLSRLTRNLEELAVG